MPKQHRPLVAWWPLVVQLMVATHHHCRSSAFTSVVVLSPLPQQHQQNRASIQAAPRSRISWRLGSPRPVSSSNAAAATTGGFLFANDGGGEGGSSSGIGSNNHHHHHHPPVDNNDSVLKEFAKKEAAILQRKADAAAQLSRYEASLNELQTQKRAYMAQVVTTPVGGSFSETAWRSAVKAFCWRLLAGSITFCTTLKFSGSVRQALQVVGADFFSKSFTMFLGERLMNKSQVGRQRGGDNAGRSLAKALIWRLFAICNTLTMAIFIAKDLSIASKIASTDAVFKTALMFFYERVWARIDWGKEYLIEFSI